MNIHEHISIEGKFEIKGNFNSIEELAIAFDNAFISACESMYSKDSMTNGIIPRAELIKATVKGDLKENGIKSKKLTESDYEKNAKDILESEKGQEEFCKKDLDEIIEN